MSEVGESPCLCGEAGGGGGMAADQIEGLWDNDILSVDGASFFYDATFPPLPEFPCMSSSSSSSSPPAQAPHKSAGPSSSYSSAASSSSPASWVLLKSDPEEVSGQTANLGIPPLPPPPPESIGYMECNEMWDPSSVFQNENFQELIEEREPETRMNYEDKNEGLSFLNGNSELAMIFLDWLKQNKDYISAEDMRSIKLKRSTIESASRRLGSDKEGKKQLLKLILEWVERHQLQKKRTTVGETSQDFNFIQNPDFPYPDPKPYFAPVHVPPPLPQPMIMPPLMAPGFNADPYMDYQQVIDSSPPVWQMAPQFGTFPENCNFIGNQQGLYGRNPYHQVADGANFEGLARLGSSATKEARKKRMARQRKVHSHGHRYTDGSNQQPLQLSDHPLVQGEGEVSDLSGNWVYWPTGNSPDPATAIGCTPCDPMSSSDRGGDQSSGDRALQQGWKTEKNLKFLLQKVLKQSDVGSLGRIVLPKREAESHLPELESRDGISIAMEDIGTSRVWNMRYRFWPNNKSRMYLLENTGDFVRMNGLQEGDFIVIYSDTKCGKYMIRGVKVRQPGVKTEAKKPARKNCRNR